MTHEKRNGTSSGTDQDSEAMTADERQLLLWLADKFVRSDKCSCRHHAGIDASPSSTYKCDRCDMADALRRIRDQPKGATAP